MNELKVGDIVTLITDGGFDFVRRIGHRKLFAVKINTSNLFHIFKKSDGKIVNGETMWCFFPTEVKKCGPIMTKMYKKRMETHS